MNGSSPEPLAIIVAMTEPAAADFPEKLTRFAEEAGPLGEVFVIDSSGGLSVEWLARDFPNVRVLYRPIGQLAPLLWRDGLCKTEATYVAFSTSKMLVSVGWRASLIDRLVEMEASGVGGPIAPAPTLSPLDRAIALLRYSRYFPPLAIEKVHEPPGDNALYRRDRLQEVEGSWNDGFWEVEVHQALRARGWTLSMAKTAVATYGGGSRFRVILKQRMRHAKRYGAGRAKHLSLLSRGLKIVCCPLVPPLLCLRALANLRSRRMPLAPWLLAGPGLMILASAWAIGEAVGTWQGLPAPARPSRRTRLSPK